jgi:hypothetical protein
MNARAAVGLLLMLAGSVSTTAGTFGELDGYTIISHFGTTVESSTNILYRETAIVCRTGCAYRMYGVNDIRWTRNGNRVAGGGFSIASTNFRERLSGPGATGECYAATSSANYDITAGTAAGTGITIPYMPWTLDEGGPWGGSDCIPSPTPPPPPPPLEVCDHCTDGSIVNEPLVLDFEGNGIATTDQRIDPVWFDLNADGVRDKTAWTVAEAEDAFLYVDWNRNHVIDGGQELFGDNTMLPSGTKARHGYEALAAYDHPSNGGNGDGLISRADRIWPRLRLWFDRNHDGLATNDENYTLASRGVVDLVLTYTIMTAAQNYGMDANGNYHVAQGSFGQRFRGDRRGLAMHEIYFVARSR